MIIRLAFIAFLTQAPQQPAQAPRQSAAPKQPTAATSVSPPALDTSSSLQVALLRQEIALLRDYQGHLLETVYYTLGALGAITLVMAGFSWWSNTKMYDRDLAALQRELQSQVTSNAARVEGELRQGLEKRVGDLAQANGAELRDGVKKLREELTSAVAKAISDLTSDVQGLQDDLLSNEAEKSLRANRPAAALGAHIQRLGLIVKRKQWYRYDGVIEDVKEAITAVQKANAGRDLDVHYTAQLVETLQQLPPEYQLEASRLQDAVQRLAL